ncbi:MAG: hypothetical protein IPF92_29665 [Myxococcales bacterium]|nr:hypothetical protein [Myxococcales bacterium]MBL0196849.1 hypothetical protein [Myxococcales bacterium]HQY63839.1 hypothetical protein [Polyangiaceae bacterium]
MLDRGVVGAPGSCAPLARPLAMCDITEVRVLGRRRALVTAPTALWLAASSRRALAAVASVPSDGTSERARWLAGVAALEGVAPTDEWRAYAQREGERWARAEPRLRAMRAWSARELASVLPAEYNLFYPFAGPDALHALALFGGARRAVLVGLEPPGQLPDPERFARGTFARLSDAMGDLHRLTFFRTREMSSAFQREEGVLPVLVATLVRMGGRVARVSVTGAPAPSARIEWITAEGAARTLEYLACDLSNAGLQRAPSLVASVRGLARPLAQVAFVKAAMYLLAEPRFSRARELLLDHAHVLVQDDTGVPLRYLEPRWATRLYGRYVGPGAPYEARDQPALHDAYARRAPAPLPFGIGYHVQPASSNLLVASRGGS